MTALLITIGAMLGALSRYYLGLYLNPLMGAMSIGVLAVNLIGCFLIGICMALSLSDHARLLMITGFLGSFTTFSAFSADVVDRLLAGKYTLAISILLLHSVGGILCTVLGFWLLKLYKT